MELFVEGFNGSALSDWLTAVCFMAIPVAALAYWMSPFEQPSEKDARKIKKD